MRILSVEAGNTLEFNTDVGMSVQPAGSLSAEGDSANPVIFTGKGGTPGSWRGLAFDGAIKTTNST